MPLVDEIELETPAGQPNIHAQFFTPLGVSSSLLSDSLKAKLLADVADIPPDQTAKLSGHWTTEGWVFAFAARKHTTSADWSVHVWAEDDKGPAGIKGGVGGSVTF